MPFAREAFATLGEVLVKEERGIDAADVRDADILAVRSTTRVDQALLAGSRVRFVGTATIGTDHMDIPWLEQQGIAWCFAPGCNANSVAEYVTAALLVLAHRHGLTLAGRTIGVIGVGNVGSRVAGKARALGLRVLENDPPRQRAAEAEGRPHAFVPLERLLAESDIVTLHVPLTRGGPDPTWQLANAAFFARLRPGAVFINAARGAVVNSDALLTAAAAGRVAHTVLDTWEGEPALRLDVLERVDLGTPHIAGHSFEGKAFGTVMVYEAACRFLGQTPAWRIDPFWPAPPVPVCSVAAAGRTDEQVLGEAVRAVYDIQADDRRLREAGAAPAGAAAHFDGLRKRYPMRREFRFTRLELPGASAALRAQAAALGFAVPSAE